jgi:hypothetical protein
VCAVARRPGAGATAGGLMAARACCVLAGGGKSAEGETLHRGREGVRGPVAASAPGCWRSRVCLAATSECAWPVSCGRLLAASFAARSLYICRICMYINITCKDVCRYVCIYVESQFVCMCTRL